MIRKTITRFLVLAAATAFLTLTPSASAQTATCFSKPVEPYTVVSCCQFWQGCARGCSQTTYHHTAEDISGTAGTSIKAAADGVLRHAQSRTAFGGVVILEHQLPSGEVVTTLYGHLDPNTLPVTSIGTRVSRGQVIGYLGTEAVNGGYAPHLHFAINKGAYAEDTNACNEVGSWRYSGYTSCAAEQSRWYVPSDFLATYTCHSCGADQFANVPSDAKVMMSNQQLAGECISPAGDLDWFLFFGERGQVVTLRAYPAPGSAWPVQMGLKRWAPTDSQIDATNEASTSYAITNEARVTSHTLTETGRFFVKISGNGAATGPYVFEKQNVFRDVGNSAASALKISLPFTGTEFIDRALEEDWYEFTLASSARVRIEVINQNAQSYSEAGRPLQMQAALFQSGSRIAGATETSGNAVLEYQLGVGTYHVKVRGYDVQLGYYRINVTLP
jgi:hypothetical protein